MNPVCLSGPSNCVEERWRIILDHRCAGLYSASYNPGPGGEALTKQVACHGPGSDAEDQFAGLFIHQEQSPGFAVQNADSVLENIAKQRFLFERGSKLTRDLIQRGKLVGALLCFLQAGGL